MVRTLVFLCMFLLLLAAGCERTPPAIPAMMELQPQIISKGHVPRKVFYYPEIAGVLSSRPDGTFLASLFDGRGDILAGVFAIDPVTYRAYKILEPQPGYVIASAYSDAENRLIWVEKAQGNWFIYSKKGDEETRVLDTGAYTAATGQDFPSLSLHAGKLVYDVTREVGRALENQICFLNLTTGESKVLASLAAEREYLGPPSLYGDYVVWNHGEWKSTNRSQVYLYDLRGDTVEMLDLQGLSGVSPLIYGDHIVVNTYASNSQECKNITILQLQSREIVWSTQLTPEDRKEYYLPSFQHKLVLWNGQTERPVQYHLIDAEEGSYPFYELENCSEIKVTSTWIDYQLVGKQGTYLFPVLDAYWPSEFIYDNNEVISSLDRLTSLSELDRLSPPEVVALYLEAKKIKDMTTMDSVMAYTETGNEWIRELWEEEDDATAEEISSYQVSKDYISDGKNARVGYLLNGDQAKKLILEKYEHWKIIPLSGN